MTISISKPQLIIFDQAFVSGINFITGLLLARALGASGYGLYILCFGFILFFSTVQVSIVISQMMITGATLKKEDASKYYLITRVFQLVSSFAAASIVLIFGNIALGYLEGWDDQLITPLALAIFSFLFQDYIRRELFSKDKTLSGLMIDLTCYGTRIVALFVLTIDNSLDISKTLIIIAISSSISFLYLFDKSILFSRPSTENWYKASSSHWHNGKWLLLNSLANRLSSQLVLYATGFIVSTAAVGRMGATQNIVGFSSIIFQAMENFVPTNAARIYNTGTIHDLNKYLLKIALYGGIISLAIVILAGVFAKPLLSLVYSNYTEDSWLIWFWGVYFFLGFFTRPLTAGLRVLNDTRSIFIATLFGALFATIAGIMLIKSFDVTGSMIALCLIQALILLTLFIKYKRLSTKIINNSL